jgi:hypothetical protein
LRARARPFHTTGRVAQKVTGKKPEAQLPSEASTRALAAMRSRAALKT